MQNYTITETITKEIKIEFPTYTETHNGSCKYAVLAEHNIICVQDWGEAKSVDFSRVMSAAFHETFKTITEKEFCDFYKKTSDEIASDCQCFLDGIDNKRYELQTNISVPLPDKDYADEQMESADRFSDKLNDYHERQIESQFEREAGEVSF